jgi:hypothetical protein
LSLQQRDRRKTEWKLNKIGVLSLFLIQAMRMSLKNRNNYQKSTIPLIQKASDFKRVEWFASSQKRLSLIKIDKKCSDS